MMFDIPILVEQRRNKAQTSFHVQPLFLDEFRVRRDRLGSALSKLSSDIRRYVETIRGFETETEFLTRLSFNPDLTVSRQKLELILRREVIKLTFCVAAFPHLETQQAFLPADRNLWIQYEKKYLKSRLTDLLTDHFRELEKRPNSGDALKQRQAILTASGNPWLTHLRINISTRRRRAKSNSDDRLSFFGSSTKFVGAAELDAVGSCLDQLYPDELHRALLRNTESELLRSLMESSDQRPVLILGAPRVGKTTLVHEYVFNAVRNRDERHRSKHNVWHLPPQRIVSGMSYVGQWEDRVLSILQFMKKKRHILYLDDMLGMYQAGAHSKSSLSAADVLKPFIERRDLQLLVEMTPGQLRVFRERDRGFADMFQILRLEATPEEDTIRILVHAAQRLEKNYHAEFEIDVIPTVLALSRRYDRESAFPGKAVKQLQELAVKHTERTVSRQTVLNDFRTRTGFQEGFVDANIAFARDEMLQSLSRDVLGQPEAVSSVCDVMSVARARLNDPHRPLGAFLFPGPTGVGKTHCAKSLAKYLYGDVSRLLRFDMNEYQTSWSVARLVGTFDQPDGLLTSAVRRQPFCVILFDEIEKAHPDVNDMLLQVLGEARLTDSLGRTVDFSGTVIILTSNLGSREAAGRVGLGNDTQATADTVYLKAVRDFFRPEFVNRFDRIIPFRPLKKDDIRGIAESLLADLLLREGFMRRKCCIELNVEVLKCVVERGFQPDMGARAMRRALEQEIVRPVASRLAEINPETPSIVRLSADSKQICADVFDLQEAAPLPHMLQPVPEFGPTDFAERMQKFLDRVQAAISARRPTGALAVADIPDEQYWYLGASALLRALNNAFLRFKNSQSESQATVNTAGLTGPPKQQIPSRLIRNHDGVKPRRILKDLAAATDIHSFIQELMAGSPDANKSSTAMESMLDSAKRLHLLVPAQSGWKEDRVLLVARALTPEGLLDAHKIMRSIVAKHVHVTTGVEDTDAEDQQEEIRFGCRFYVQNPDALPGVRSKSASERFHVSLPETPGEPNRYWTELLPDSDATADSQRLLCVAVVGGYRAAELLDLEQGTHLRFDATGRMVPVQVAVHTLKSDQTPSSAFQELLQSHDGFAWRSVLSIRNDDRRGPADQSTAAFDMRTLTVQENQQLLPLLPLPPEFLGDES